MRGLQAFARFFRAESRRERDATIALALLLVPVLIGLIVTSSVSVLYALLSVGSAFFGVLVSAPTALALAYIVRLIMPRFSFRPAFAIGSIWYLVVGLVIFLVGASVRYHLSIGAALLFWPVALFVEGMFVLTGTPFPD